MKSSREFFKGYSGEIFFVCFCFFFYFCWAQLIPYNDAPDESLRFAIARFICHNGKLPFGNEAEIMSPLWGQSYAFQPIFAYQIAALFMRGTLFFGMPHDQLYLSARFANTLIATGTVVLLLAIGKNCFKYQGHYLFAALICLLPQFIFISSYVNNDTLAFFSVTLIVYAWILGMKNAWNLKACIFLAVGLSLCLLSYYNAYGFILCSGILYIGDYLINRKKWPFKKFLKYGLIILGLCAFLAGWWFIRNAVLHDGDFLGMRSSAALAEQFAAEAYKPSQHVTPQNSGYTVMQMLLTPFQETKSWLYVTGISLVGNFQYNSCPMPMWTYLVIGVIWSIGGIGSLFWWVGTRRKEEGKRGRLWRFTLLVAMSIPVAISVYYSYTSDYQPQGRYIISFLVPLMYFVTHGLLWIEKKWCALQIAPTVIGSELIISFYALCETLEATL